MRVRALKTLPMYHTGNCLAVISDWYSVCFCLFQKMQRLLDARQVEEKAQRIKDWVTCKLQEVSRWVGVEDGVGKKLLRDWYRSLTSLQP